MPRPGPVRVCVCLLFLAGSGGRASRARSGAPHLFLWPLCLSAFLGPLRAGVARVLLLFFFFLLGCCPPRALFFACFLWFLAPGTLGLGAVCCLSCWPRASRPSVRSRSFCVARLAVGCCLLVAAPPPLLCLAVFLAAAPCLVFFFWSAPPLSIAFCCFRPRLPWALALCFAFLFLPPLALRALSLFFSPAWPLAAPWCLVPPPPLPLCLAGFVAAAPGPPFFFVLRAPPLSLAFCGFRPRVPWALALCFVCFVSLRLLGSPCALAFFLCLLWSLVGPWWLLPPPPPLPLGVPFYFFFCVVLPRCLRLSLVPGPGCLGPRRCALFALLASCFSAPRAFSPLSCLPFGRWLLPGGCCPPPPFVSRGFRCFRSVLCAVCCAVLCVPGCGAALRCCALCRPVLCCCVLCCFAALVWCRCSSCRALWCSPLPWGPVSCGAVFCGVPPRCVCFVVAWWCVLLFAALLCAVCVPGCCAVRSLSPLLCAVLWFTVLVRLRCAVRVVRAVAGAWCCGALLCVVLFPLVCCGAVLGLVARGCLLVPCCGALLSVFLCWGCWFVSFPCVCGAVLRCASCSSVPVWSALLLLPRAVACPCVLWCLPGRSAVWWCCSVVSGCHAVLCVVLRPVLCPAVLCCLAVLCWLAVLCGCLRCWCLFFLLSSFPLLKTPAVFPCL